MTPTRATFSIGHFSDSHLGYEAYPALSSSGVNQRGDDVARSFHGVASDIRAQDPPLVIHAGDVGERPRIDTRYMLFAQKTFAQLAEIRPDGSRRQVVIIAGNHDQPRSRKEACWLELLDSIPGVNVVTDTYRVVRFSTHDNPEIPRELDGVAVHCLPHDTLKEIDFASVVPDDHASANVLVAHGVAEGSELFTRSLGREYAIDVDMLRREWDYVALGHYHTRGPVKGGRRGGVDRVWYSGSSEHISYRDLRDNNARRGYLFVRIDAEELTVTPVDLATRAMFRLPVVDATNKSPEEITEAMIARLGEADIDGAVVSQIVEGVTRDVWSLLDISSVREHARGALHYEVSARYVHVDRDTGDGPTSGGLGDLSNILNEEIANAVSPALVEPVGAMAKRLLAGALAATSDTPQAPNGDVSEKNDEEKA